MDRAIHEHDPWLVDRDNAIGGGEDLQLAHAGVIRRDRTQMLPAMPVKITRRIRRVSMQERAGAVASCGCAGVNRSEHGDAALLASRRR